jgi:hypothetical protein
MGDDQARQNPSRTGAEKPDTDISDHLLKNGRLAA